MATQSKYRLGLKTPQPGAIPLKLRNYLTPSLLPSVDSLPLKFGHDNLIQSWGMLGNDQYGCCAEASACHSTMLWTAEANHGAPFDTAAALQNYAAITGFNPADPATDDGTDIGALFRYWQQTGIVDANGNYHQIVGAAGLTVGDWDELLIALRLFQTVTIGIDVPSYAEAQFEAGQPWHVQRGRNRTVGGHCIPAVARTQIGRVDTVSIVTWGAEIPMEKPFYEKFCIVAAVGLSEEMLINAASIDGVDDQQLRADLGPLNTGEIT